MIKAEITRQLGISRAYVTMVCNGKRKWTDDFVNKLRSLELEPSQLVNKLNVNGTSNRTIEFYRTYLTLAKGILYPGVTG